MNPAALQALLDKLHDIRIGIVGDFCLDAYIVLDPRGSELSVETGLPTRPVRTQRYTLGGAGNVAANLRAMGVGHVAAFGVTGIDPFGKEMRMLLEKAGIVADGLLRQEEEWETHVYMKPVESNKEQSRIDFGNFNDLHQATAAALLKNLEDALPSLDILIINEQVKQGIHNEELRNAIRQMILHHSGKLFIADSRHYADAYEGAVRKVNLREAMRLLGGDSESSDALNLSTTVREVSGRLFERWKVPLYVSRGEYGCAVYDEAGFYEVPGLLITGPIDPVGAGDSLLAGIAAGLAAGASHTDAAELGSFAAGVTLRKLFQTGTATPEEILAVGSSPEYRYKPELARYASSAQYYRNTEIEVVTELPEGRHFTHCICDNDGTISTLRQGWEEIMEPMMMRAILGEKEKEVDESFHDQVVESVQRFIDKTTGVQTIAQMKGLVDLVRHFGCVPESEILDEFGYKERYSAQLLAMVNVRLRKLQAGELDVEDFTVKKAVPFLRALKERGVILYLASGTNQDDVRREAEILGYADIFGGRIVGSVGDIARDAKRVVLERILQEIGDGTRRCVLTFGDGPVEIRETSKRGGYTVGVASNEVRRYGLNPTKRRRLIEAGADLLVPDFSQMGHLLDLLFRG